MLLFVKRWRACVCVLFDYQQLAGHRTVAGESKQTHCVAYTRAVWANN